MNSCQHLLLLFLLGWPPCQGEGGAGDWDFHSQYQPQAPPAPVAQDRVDPGGPPPQIDAALLRQVLEDPVLLQAVDPNVLQMVLVQAATANLLTIPAKLPSTTTTPPPPPPPPLNPKPLLPRQSPPTVSSSTVEDLPHRLDQIQVDLPNLEPAEGQQLSLRPPRRSPSLSAPANQQVVAGIGSKLDTASLAQALRDHPDIAAELAVRLQMEPDLAAELGLLSSLTDRRPPVPPPSCPQITPEGAACSPGLAYSSISRACEWPDTLMENGCNPEGEPIPQKKGIHRTTCCSSYHGIWSVPSRPKRSSSNAGSGCHMADAQVSV